MKLSVWLDFKGYAWVGAVGLYGVQFGHKFIRVLSVVLLRVAKIRSLNAEGLIKFRQVFLHHLADFIVVLEEQNLTRVGVNYHTRVHVVNFERPKTFKPFDKPVDKNVRNQQVEFLRILEPEY